MSAKVTFTGNLRSAPPWMGDFGGREHILPVPAKLDAASFANRAGVPVTLTAGANQGDTTLTVSALTLAANAVTTLISSGNVAIPAGSLIAFSAGVYARTTVDAYLGDTTITVEALPAAVPNGASTTWSRFGFEYIPSGTAIGRTFAERDAGTPYGPAAVSDDEIFLLAFDVPSAGFNNDCELYRHGSLVRENYLPDAAILSAAANERQVVAITGTPTGGTFDVTYNGATTAPLAYNASTATVQTAIQGLPNVGAGNALVTGSAGNYTVTFAGALAGAPQGLLAIDTSGLTGGTPAANVTRPATGGTTLLTVLRKLYQCIKGQD